MAGSAHAFGRQLTIRFDDLAEAGKRAKPRRLARGLRCMASGHVFLPVGDIKVSLGWADVKLRAAGRDGFAAAVDRDVTVALDTTVTPHLRRKALARHLVHHIQMMRKEARLNADDRIRLSVDAQGEVAEAIA